MRNELMRILFFDTQYSYVPARGDITSQPETRLDSERTLILLYQGAFGASLSMIIWEIIRNELV